MGGAKVLSHPVNFYRTLLDYLDALRTPNSTRPNKGKNLSNRKRHPKTGHFSDSLTIIVLNNLGTPHLSTSVLPRQQI